MLAEAQVCHLSRKDSRAAQTAMTRARKRKAQALAKSPVVVEKPIPRLDPQQLTELEIDTVGLPSRAPGLWAVVRDTSRPEGVAPVLTDAECAAAAMRQHIASEKPYGPIVRRPAIITFLGSLDVEEVLLVGQLSAVERTAPDMLTLEAWREAGVQGLDDPGSVRVVFSHV